MLKNRIGMCIDEINIGDKASFTKTITDTEIILYTAITGDFNPIHVDEEYAKNTVFGRRVAHGTIALGLIGPVLGMQLPGLGTILMGASFRNMAAVYPGDTITAEVEAVEKIIEKRIVRFGFKISNQHGEAVITGDAMVRPPD